MDFCKKLILAPMVRIGQLPMRLLALHYGADIVYCEEIVDYKMLQCRRVVNPLLETVDFVWNDGTIVFRTCKEEAGRVVFQMGTCDAQRALTVARMIENDVDAIDINMGCPKEFSIKGGMGAALLTHPEKIKEILTTLVPGVSKPITCKIRILPTLAETLHLVRLIQSTGVTALAVHGRTKEERPKHANHDDVIAAVAKELTIPVIANGGSASMTCIADVHQFRADTGSSSVMVARAAQWNPSVFSATGPESLDDVIRKYIDYAIRYDSCLANVKYCVQQLLHEKLETEIGRTLLGASSIRDICAIWGVDNRYDTLISERETRRKALAASVESHHKFDTSTLPDGSTVFQLDFKYERRLYVGARSAKMNLHEWSLKLGIQPPKYETIQHPGDRMFRSVVTFRGRKFATTFWEKSKKHSEQAAAIVCIRLLAEVDKECPKPLPEMQQTIASANSNTEHATETVKTPVDGRLRRDSQNDEHENSGRHSLPDVDFNICSRSTIKRYGEENLTAEDDLSNVTIKLKRREVNEVESQIKLDEVEAVTS